METGKARRGGAGRTAVRFLRHFEHKNSKNVSIFEVRSRFERENGNFESEERGTVNDFINLLLRVIHNPVIQIPTTVFEQIKDKTESFSTHTGQ